MTGSDAHEESISSPWTRVRATTPRSGIQRSPEFEKKGLASHAVNVGLKCVLVLLPIRPHPPSLNQ